MDGREGFRQTKLGWIPDDWEVIDTEKMLKNKKGAIKIGPFGSQLKKEFFVKNGYKVYGQENIFENDFSIGDRFVDSDRFNQLKTCQLEVGDFAISMMGTVGKCAIIPDSIQTGIMDSHLFRLQIDENVYDKNLLIHLFTSDMIKKLSVGGIMDGLSSKIVKSLRLTYFNNSNQQASEFRS